MLPGIRQATNDSIFANGSNIHLTDVVAPLSCNVSASLGSLFRIQLQSSKFMIGHFLCICSECRVFILFAGIYCQHDLQGVLHVLHVFFHECVAFSMYGACFPNYSRLWCTVSVVDSLSNFLYILGIWVSSPWGDKSCLSNVGVPMGRDR